MVHRFSVLLLTLALVAGPVVQVVQASDMATKMSMASATDMPIPVGCSGCTGDDQGMAACFAVCNSSVVAILPFGPAIGIGAMVSLPAPLIASVAGHHGPPDPYPPRPTILG